MINWRTFPRLVLAVMLSLSAFLVAAPAHAASERALYLYYTHTKETARIVFKRNGQYDRAGLNELNVFLRDWRQNEPANMDPRLFDLVWEVYQEVGGSQPVNVVSAYRSPKTNAMLAKNSSGVADNSQHMRGTAMDFFIPGVSLAKLRAAAMRKQVGGVGYYPTSGSPFVHLDTGSVRAWPRMTRAQLKEIFPDGRTMHLPNDGKPLSQEGYQIAMAEWKRCHAYPCNGSSSGTQVASGGSGRTLMDVIFGGGNQQAPAAAAAPPSVAATAPAQPTIQTASLSPRTNRIEPVMPVQRPADLGGVASVAATPVADAAVAALPFSTVGSAPLDAAELTETRTVAFAMPSPLPADLRAQTAGDAATALAALAPTMPTPRVIMTEPPSETMSAYLPRISTEPGAQRALEAIIGQSNTASAVVGTAAPVQAKPLAAVPMLSASNGYSAGLGGQSPATGNALFDQTFGATQAADAEPLAVALAAHVAGRGDEMRRPELVAPDLDHVAEVFMAPVSLESGHFAVIFDHDEADFDPTTEMGQHVLVKGVGDAAPVLSSNRFSRAPTQVN